MLVGWTDGGRTRLQRQASTSSSGSPLPSLRRPPLSPVPSHSLPGRQDSKVVCCALLSFVDRNDLELEFHRQHAAERGMYDTIRGLLRLAAWAGFAVKAARAGSLNSACGMACMLAATVIYSLAPLVLLALRPASYLKWRCDVIAAWNLGHAVMLCAFYPQLYPGDLVPPGSIADMELNLASLAGWLLWLLWHSQALIMALNAGAPLANCLKHFLVGQFAILMLHLHTNAAHCAFNGQLQTAVSLLHTRMVLPAMALLRSSFGARPGPTSPTAAWASSAGGCAPAGAVQLCTSYLAIMQMLLGLALPSYSVFCTERRQRSRFLAERGMRAEHLAIRTELGFAVAAAGLQLVAFMALDSQ